MQALSPEFWLIFLLIVLGMGSLAVWLPIAVRWNNDGTVLPYEPRKRVPWNFLGAAPAILLVVLAFIRAIGSPDETAELNAGAAVVLVGMVIAAAAIVHLAGGSRFDLGLPRDTAQLRRDVVVGMLAWLAALLPIFGVQWILFQLYGEPSQNPVIKQVQQHPDWQTFATAFVSAVLVAPIFEEFVFRLLLQGWLERVEDAVVGFRATERRQSSTQITLPDTELQSIEIHFELPIAAEAKPPRWRFVAGVSHGFVPIIASSLLFSLAHLGFGFDPIALFVLALFLGYLYQRTHRIVPCIVVHSLFNALNLLMLWITLQIKQP